MQALRSGIKWVMVVSVTATACLFVLPWAFAGRQRFVFRVARIWAAVLLALAGIRVLVEKDPNHSGIASDADHHPKNESEPASEARILLANHQSFLDVVAFCYALPGPVAYMAKDSLFRIPVFGQVLRGIGCIPVDRKSRAGAGRAVAGAVEAIQAGRRVMIFPEGTRSRADGGLMPFKRGAFLLAKQTGVALQALTVSGAGRIMPAGQKGVRIQRIYRGTIRIVVHPVIEAREFAELEADELSARVRRLIDRPLDRLGVLAEMETSRH